MADGSSKMNGAQQPDVGATDAATAMAGLPFAKADLDAVVDSQIKNLDAIHRAQYTAMVGAQTVFARQFDMACHMMDGVAAMFSDFATPGGSAADRIARHAEASKQVYRTAMAQASEVAELAIRGNADTVAVLNARLVDSFAEMRDATAKRFTPG